MLKVGDIVTCNRCRKIFKISKIRAYRYKDRGDPTNIYCSFTCKSKPVLIHCSSCNQPINRQTAHKYKSGILCNNCNKEDYEKWIFNPTISLHDLVTLHLTRHELCQEFNINSTVLQKHIEFYGIEEVFCYTCHRCNKPLEPTKSQKLSIIKGKNIYCKKCLPLMAAKAKFSETLGHVVRSSYEEIFGLWLQKQNILYQYEPYGFLTPYGYYYPDFYIKFHDTYIETKGYFRSRKSIQKLWYFSKRQNIMLLMSGEIEMIKEDLENSSCKINFCDLQKFSEKNIKKMKNNAFFS